MRKKDLKDKVSLIVGTDELGVSLLAKISNEINQINPKYKVFYSTDEDKKWIAPHDDRNLKEIVEEKIDLVGGTIVKDDADINIFVNRTQNDEFEKNIIDYLNQDKYVIIIDMGNKDTQLIPDLLNEVDLIKLTSYSGWNTAGNAIGIGLAHGNLKYNYDMFSESLSKDEQAEAKKAHDEFLYERIIKDHIYKRESLYEITNKLSGLNVNNLRIENKHSELAKETIKTEMSNYLDILDSFGASENKSCKLRNFSLPWSRLFEIKLDIDCQNL